MTPTSELRVSEVRIRMADRAGDGLVAWASCVVNGCLFLNNIAIRRGGDGEIVLTYPSTRSRRDVKYFYFRPINADAKEALDRAILGGLQELTEAR
jgi:DNA-binding cell septation regulator SpoVG